MSAVWILAWLAVIGGLLLFHDARRHHATMPPPDAELGALLAGLGERDLEAELRNRPPWIGDWVQLTDGRTGMLVSRGHGRSVQVLLDDSPTMVHTTIDDLTRIDP